jgi:hypothetical protein
MAAARRRSLADEAETRGSPSVGPSPSIAPESRDELLDVPAAIVCVICGSSDCLGCAEERSRSGVIAIVPWERPGGTFERLWSTAKAATLNAEAFFEALPEGPLAPALRFALFAEIVAASAMLVVVGGLAAGALFLLGGAAAFDPASLGFLFRATLASVFGLALLLVAAHAAHGLALGAVARKRGVRADLSRALRFGLYSAGWDLVLGPVGAIGLLREKRSLLAVAVGLPTRSALAFLRGTYRLEGAEAKPALHASYVAAVGATLFCAFAMLAALTFVVLR